MTLYDETLSSNSPFSSFLMVSADIDLRSVCLPSMSGKQCGRVKSPMRFDSDDERERAFLITASFIDIDLRKIGRLAGISSRPGVVSGCDSEIDSSIFGGSFSHFIRLL